MKEVKKEFKNKKVNIEIKKEDKTRIGDIAIYDGNECTILKKNKDEVLIKFLIYDYLLGSNKEIIQWVKEKLVKEVK